MPTEAEKLRNFLTALDDGLPIDLTTQFGTDIAAKATELSDLWQAKPEADRKLLRTTLCLRAAGKTEEEIATILARQQQWQQLQISYEESIRAKAREAESIAAIKSSNNGW